jgi:hypothetical protein
LFSYPGAQGDERPRLYDATVGAAEGRRKVGCQQIALLQIDDLTAQGSDAAAFQTGTERRF